MDVGAGDFKTEYLDPTQTDASTALLMVIDNPTDQPIKVALSLSGMVKATGVVTSVPEPESYALVLMGLAVVLLGQHRRLGMARTARRSGLSSSCIGAFTRWAAWLAGVLSPRHACGWRFALLGMASLTGIPYSPPVSARVGGWPLEREGASQVLRVGVGW